MQLRPCPRPRASDIDPATGDGRRVRHRLRRLRRDLLARLREPRRVERGLRLLAPGEDRKPVGRTGCPCPRSTGTPFGAWVSKASTGTWRSDGLPAWWRRHCRRTLSWAGGMSVVPGSLTAALLTAVCAGPDLPVLVRRSPTERQALIAFALFGFTTPVWTVAANLMWPQTLTVLGIAGMAWAAASGRWWLAGAVRRDHPVGPGACGDDRGRARTAGRVPSARSCRRHAGRPHQRRLPGR